jgi:hypothetical protein
VSRTPPRHKKPPRRKRVRVAAAAAGSALLISAAVAVVSDWRGERAHPAAVYQASALHTRAAGGGPGTANSSKPAPTKITAPARHTAAAQHTATPATQHSTAPAHAAEHAAAQRSAARRGNQRRPRQHPAASAYRNPLRAVSDLVVERVEQGADFGGAGPVYALGDGVVTSATASDSGWPGGGWITYRLTDGPDTGLTVYVAEDVTPAVQAGQPVTSSTVIANMFNGGDGIETGWAPSAVSTAQSQPPGAGDINGNGPFPAIAGLNFEAVLETLGVPAARGAS